MKLLLTLTGIFLCVGLYAQQKKVVGMVTGKDSTSPLVGVAVKSSLETVLTDENGRFSVTVSGKEIITFSYVGMKTVNYTYDGETGPIHIEMEYRSGDLNEVVVTGYQTQKKADLTGAVSVVKLADIKDVRVGSATKALQGRIPGVMITSDGSPGGGATVRIRGIGTLGNNDPLYVIDGTPTKRGLQEINQDDIESIQVLKDASSATIYGSRAANGVIIVTTKKGKNGISKLDVSASTSMQSYTHRQQMLNTEQHGQAYWQAAVNDQADPNNNQIYQYDWNKDYTNPVLNKVILPDFIDASKTMKPANTDWYKEIAQTSILQNYNVAFSNGSKKGNTYLSMSYYDNKGIIKETGAKKLTLRINTDFNFFDGKLKIGENLNGTYASNLLIPTGDVFFTALVQNPIVPVYTVTGGWGGPAAGMTDRQNPIRLIEDNAQNRDYFLRIIANVYADLSIFPSLHFRTNYAVDYNGTYSRTLRKSYSSGFLTDPSNLVQNNQDYDGNQLWQNTLNYNLETGKHRIEVLLGQEYIKYNNQNFFGSREGYALENIDYSYLDVGTSNINNGGNGGAYSLLSYFGKVNYNYDSRYLASVTLRRDGSSRFGKNNQYGTFPSGSLGWRISQEKFMKALPFISDLKLRYGYGQSGNQETGNYATYGLYAAIYGTDHVFDRDGGTAYDIGGANTGTLPSGFVKTQQANESLEWETTKESNFGLDFGLFDQHLTGSVDYFRKNTSGILITPGYLAVIGEGGTTTFNGASMRNTGLEIGLNYQEKINPDLSIAVGANISNYHNTVTYLPDEVLTAYPGNGTTQTIVGHSINAIFGYVADGLFTTEEEVTNSAQQPGKGLGRIRFKDLNDDGVINSEDRTYITNGNPDFIYGFNLSVQWKNLDFTAFFQGVQGLQVYNSYKTFTDFTSLWPGSNWGPRVLDSWTPQNPRSGIPALTLANTNDEGRTSTYFLENGSYMKLRNLQIGYNLKDVLKSLKIQNARLYLQAVNLFTLKSKGYTATDPENPGNGYPLPLITTIGIDLSF